MEDIEGVRTGPGDAMRADASGRGSADVSGSPGGVASDERTPTSAGDVGATTPVAGAGSPICPYLARAGADGSWDPPVPEPSPLNECAASLPPLPQSARQQQLVCLQDAHLTCPRYLRGSLRVADMLPPSGRRTRTPRAIVAALLILLFSASGAVGFVVARGGLAVPGLQSIPPDATRNSTLAAVVSASPSGPSVAPETPSAAATAAPNRPTPAPATHQPSTSQPAPATPSPPPPTSAPSTPIPTPPASPLPTPSPVSGTGSASRYAVLVPCPDRPACYIYVVRPGDNFFSIVHWFGVGSDVVLRLNPWLRDPALLVAGDRLVLPPPTR